VNFPSYLRLVRGQVLSLKASQFVEAAQSVGNGYFRITMFHILPNTLGPVLVLMCINCAWAIMTAAGLSFLGVGIPLPEPEWGAMVSVGTRYALSGEWWIAFFPGLVITLVVLSLNLIADTLQEIMDPKRRILI
jgi:peptide/nickel transport system permease protein